jgi:hypothetical protein
MRRWTAADFRGNWAAGFASHSKPFCDRPNERVRIDGKVCPYSLTFKHPSTFRMIGNLGSDIPWLRNPIVDRLSKSRFATPARRGRSKTFSDSDEKMILQLHSKQVPYPKIAAMFGLPVTTIEGLIYRRGLTKKIRPISAEVLRKLYVHDHLSILKVADHLGLPKTNVEHWMKKHGIDRRPLRVYRRRSFDGDKLEKAYLLGYRFGDLYAYPDGLGISVSTTTTHPAMLILFLTCFEKYGHVVFLPAYNKKNHAFQWSAKVTLDSSFAFLLKTPHKIPSWITKDKLAFKWFLAGFIDAEGSVGISFQVMYDRWKVARPYLSFSNSNLALMKDLEIHTRRYHFRFRLAQKGGTLTSRNGTMRRKDQWELILSRRGVLSDLLIELPIHHLEKVAKSALALKLIRGNEWDQLKADYLHLKKEIKLGVNDLATLAFHQLKK